MSSTDVVNSALRNPERLAALALSGLEPGVPVIGIDSLDRLSALAAKVLRVPLALVSLVDDERQAFQGMHGTLPEPFGSRRETPLSHSFCQHVVTTRAPLVIQNAVDDERVRGNLAIRDLNVMAYVGVPLTTANGHVLGSLCAIDTVPRQWTSEELDTLSGLASFATTELELRRTETKAASVLTRSESYSDDTRLLVHDLRTPLNSLLLGLQTLPLLGDLNEEQRDALELAHRGGQALVALVDDLLDLSMASSAAGQSGVSLALEQVDAMQALQEAIQQITALARGRGIRLAVETPNQETITIQADRDKLVRVLVNLLGNAIKFTAENGEVSAGVRIGKGERCVVFTVRDTGRGIERKDLERIFERFVRIGGDAVGRGGRSSGLGLAFCKMVADAHGGAIEVESEPGRGSVFTLSLPRAQPASVPCKA